MLNIPDNYFKDETRSGFTVPEKMKRMWATQLTMLSMIADILDRHALRWWADFGTLLGAVRHGGYIPWDDDIDIAMPRADYMRAVPVLDAELPSVCEVWSRRLRDDYGALSTFVACRKNVDTGDSEAEREITRSYYGCPFVTGVDIFPLDAVPDDREEYLAWRDVFGAVYYVAHQYNAIRDRGELEQNVVRVEELTGRPLPSDGDLRAALWGLAEEISMLYFGEKSQGLLWVPYLATDEADRVCPASAYDRIDTLPFEMIKVPVPADYRTVLTVEYDDWQKHVKGGADHEYPLYRVQEDYIRKMRDADQRQSVYDG